MDKGGHEFYREGGATSAGMTQVIKTGNRAPESAPEGSGGNGGWN